MGGRCAEGKDVDASRLEAVIDELADRVRSFDISLFAHLPVQMREHDERSLLALHAACRETYGSFVYLEVGSYLGGSLQALVRDPACERIVSIDPRPELARDARGRDSRYAENTTANMIAGLAEIPGADTAKIESLETTTDALDHATVPRPHLCLIDGEHTDEAALTDARFCLGAIRESGAIVFHDPHIVYKAIRRFTDDLEQDGVGFQAYLLPYSIFVIEVGEPVLRETGPVEARLAEAWRGYLMGMLDNDPFRMVANGRAIRLLRRLRLASAPYEY